VGRTCLVCRHPEREEIEQALAQLSPYRTIARQWPEVSKDSVGRHRGAHLPPALSKALAREEEHAASDLLAVVRRAMGRVERLAQRLEEHGHDDKARAQLVQSTLAIGRLAETIGRMRGDVEQPAVVVVQDDRPMILAFVQQVVRDPKAFEAARQLQRITDGALEVEAEVVDERASSKGTNGGSPSEGGE